jgi:hypothetical protein
VRLAIETKELLAALGAKGESYDTIVKKLIKQKGD